MFKHRLLLLVMLSAISVEGLGQESEPKKDDSAENVKGMVAAYVEAFNKKDLEKVASAWAEDATFSDRTTGERMEGRSALKDDIKAGFEAQPNLRLSATVERVKFITKEVAQIEGHSVVAGPNDDAAVSVFSAIVAKTGDKWQIKSLEESAVPEAATPYDALKELDFLVGRWVDEGEDSRVETAFRWSTNATFLIRSFSMETEDGIAHEGTQVIGWDPRAKHIRSWNFNSDGSFGEGIWSKSGEEWLIKSSQTLPDGGAASGTYVMSQTDDNTLEMGLIGHSVNGLPQPSSPSITMTRQAEEESADTETTGATEASEAAAETSEEKTDTAPTKP